MRPLVAWFVPDLALVTALVTLFYCLFVFQGYQKLFRDSDAGWHIRTGESILATHHLPRTDPYSFSRAGQPWFAWEWGADVLVGAIHRAAGLHGVALFYSSVIAAATWLWFRLHWSMSGDFLVACAMAPLLLSTCQIHWLARPHVIGWLFLVGYALACPALACPAASLKPWHAVATALSAALWANLHASFFLGAVIVAIWAIRQRHLLWLVLVASLAPLANPYGWHLYAHIFRYLTNSELLARISEFQSFDFHSPGAGQIIATMILGISGGVLALVHRRYEHFLLAILFSVLALRSARALPLAALLLLPIANSALVATFPLPWRDYAARLRAIDSRWKGYALAPIAVVLAFGLLRSVPAGFAPADFPVAAYSQIPAEARLFASDTFGGYLIYRSAGTRPVFFDGRSDFYGVDFLKQYARIVQVRPGWRELFEPYRFSHALLPADAPLIPALEQLGWEPVYRDATATLLRGEELRAIALCYNRSTTMP